MGYSARREDDENNNENIHPSDDNKKSVGSKIMSGAKKAKGAYDSYKANGGLTGMAKDAIGNKINDKVNEKKEQLKGAAKEKIGNMVPDSVKKKQQAVKGKMEAAKKKLNAPKEKLNEAKQKMNERAFKAGVRTAANALAPGTGVAAEKMLDTPIGKPALDAAKNASNPASAIKEGTKKLVEVIVKKEAVKKVAIPMIASMASMIFILLLLTSVFKFGDSQIYAHGDGTGDAFSSIIDEKYQEFYKNVETYSDKYFADKYMIISVLTSYQDNEVYSDMDTMDEDLEDVDIEYEEDGVTAISASKMKKYIKKVAKAIHDSSNGISEGDYVDRSTGSDFFWWLYDEFVDDYYRDYLNKSSKDYEKDKKEIIEFIYLYYKDLIEGNSTGFSCIPTGEEGNDVRLTTYSDEKLGTDRVDKSKISTDEKGLKYYEYEGKKYLVVATATNICIDSGCGYTDNSKTQKNYTRYSYITYYDYFDTLTISFNGQTYDAIVLDSCGGCQWAKEVRGDKTDQRIDIWVEKGSNPGVPDYGTLDSSDCTLTGDSIRLGSTGVFSESIFPIDTTDGLYISSKYIRNSGKYHGAIDISCNAGGVNCFEYKIKAAHEGIVTTIHRDPYNSYSYEAGAKTNTPYKANSKGTALIITADSGPYAGYQFYYWHLSSMDPSIKKGDRIQVGQYLGQMGNTGYSTGTHLHFQVVTSKGQNVNLDSAISNILK